MYSYMRIPPFLIPIAVGAIIQLIKMIVDIFAHKQKLHLASFWKSWWFPSVHSWLSSSIVTLVALMEWIWTTEFAVCVTFAILFWYDAANVRYEAGKHAQYINEIKDELRSFSFIDYKLQDLQERLWHTTIEVIWGVMVGSMLTIMVYFLVPRILSLTIW